MLSFFCNIHFRFNIALSDVKSKRTIFNSDFVSLIILAGLKK